MRLFDSFRMKLEVDRAKCLYDHAMFRFARQRQHKLTDNFYVRQDGTRAYFFSIEHLRKLLVDCQFHIDDLIYVFKETVNIKEEICVPRVFIQGKFRKIN